MVVLTEVLGQRRHLDEALARHASHLASPAQRALAAELAYGVLRHRTRLQTIAGGLLRHPLARRHLDIHCLILLGLYQLCELQVPAHAAVTETVAVARAAGKPWAAGLVNAVLRGYLRARPVHDRAANAEPAVYSHPPWLIQALARAWPADWRHVLEANNQRPPLWVRVNRRRISPERYLERLSSSAMAGRRSRFAAAALKLGTAVAVSDLPGFLEGEVSVQDAAAQLGAELLEGRPGGRVLDACAAPGGKTCHLLEEGGERTRVVAVDRDRKRTRRLEGNLQRLGLQAQVLVADACQPALWWDGNPFQQILLDAPCSATGVIRRHPEIKWLRQPDEVRRLVAQQRRLLHALWPLLDVGGRLLYVTCSVLPEENHVQIARFVEGCPDAREVPIDRPWGRACQHGRQVLPGEDDMDGFYYACMEKRRTLAPHQEREGRRRTAGETLADR